MPWNNCGNDFGVNYNSKIFDEALYRYASSGANSVRVWVHFDANKELKLYDSNGFFK